jgi:threonine/homoserine/homoserine lactone efflux protein
VIVTFLVLLGGLVLVWAAPRFVRAWRHADALEHADALDLPGQRPSPNGKPADGREVVEETV